MTDLDVIVIGAGPAGLQAAIQAARKKATVAVIGKTAGSAVHGTDISNYLGMASVEGDDLLACGRSQAEAEGAELFSADVVSASRDGDLFRITLDDDSVLSSRAVVLATGVSRRKLGIPGEIELFGKGVSYCAVCDCNFYRGRRVAVVGNESEAALAAELMTGYASETHWIHWEDGASENLVGRARSAGAVEHVSRPVSIGGDGKVASIELADGTVIPTDGVFIELGARSSADLAMDLGAMPEIDDSLKVGQDCSVGEGGLFACGDITGRPYQVAKAVGQGCVAGMAAADYAKEKR